MRQSSSAPASPNSPLFRPRRLLAALLTAALAFAAPLLVVAPASAATPGGQVSNVRSDKTSYGYSERVRLDFDWVAVADARQGDTFTLDLPAELTPASTVGFPLLAPDGSRVADAVWNGKQVVFTLTDYVDTRAEVRGSGFVTVQFDKSVVPSTGGGYELEINGSVVPVTVQPAPDPRPDQVVRGGSKGGYFTDTTESLIQWSLRLPGGSRAVAGNVVVDDVVGAGSTIDCRTFGVFVSHSYGAGAKYEKLPASRYRVGDGATAICTPTRISLVVDKVNLNEYINVNYKGTITDPAASSYSNSVRFQYPGADKSFTSVVTRASAGGVGSGVQRVSVGDFVWFDANRDGLQTEGEAGIPGVVLTVVGPQGQAVTSVSGAPVGPVTTDAAGRYAFTNLPVLPAGSHYTVRIDAAASATALDGYTPTEAGVGDVSAIDSSTGSAESTDLTTNGASDPTLDFGFVREGTGEGSQGSVSVGDYVWYDADGDGLQTEGEAGIPGVVLQVTGPDGAPVTKVDGSAAGPQTTDSAGAYSFSGLPVLASGQHSTVAIDQQASAAALTGYTPTTPGAGDDRAVDSSTGSAVSAELLRDGDSDLTLDFGFTKAGVGGIVVTPPGGGTGAGGTTPSAGGTSALVTTGTVAASTLWAALALLVAGGGLLIARSIRASRSS